MNALWVITGAAVLGGAVVVAVQAAAARLRRRTQEPCLPCEGYAGDCTCEWHCGALACDPKRGMVR